VFPRASLTYTFGRNMKGGGKGVRAGFGSRVRCHTSELPEEKLLAGSGVGEGGEGFVCEVSLGCY